MSANFPSILHQEPTFSILQYHFSKTHTLVYLFYNLLYLNNIIDSLLLLLFINISISFIFLSFHLNRIPHSQISIPKVSLLVLPQLSSSLKHSHTVTDLVAKQQ